MLPPMPGPAFIHRHRVSFHETDMAGVVHFSNFFRFAEITEHAFARELQQETGIPLLDHGHAWPRVHASCDYLAPARFDDLLEIHLHLDPPGTSSLRYRFEILRDATLLATGKIVVAHIDPTLTPPRATPLPPLLRQAIERRI
ncbi:MAG: acyl-CoA thioesterase [Akkermansiaceae bacterium]|jgi:YbgC/YbaW family acyl-CoA thioester hydrolase|nr:acyl-CoA thioesterase [Akkermansiaceae bacterium]